ncbi:hypothetical protein [Dubosiella muris]|uniref:Uncharacterized protein n=2 Tax=Dubosiella TaxID=1937008 RepID=A0AC61R6H7_9FIRM|nr:hypothetical protein [Dubosiella muris]TGY65749.1 hypothetical protein E5336_07145 [Dubosiella muris]
MLKLLLADRSTTALILWILIPCFALCACLCVWCPGIEFFSFSLEGIASAIAALILWYALRYSRLLHSLD